MTISHLDLLSHLVELFDYRVKEVSYVDEGANLLPFLLTKNLTRAEVKKQTFEALLRTKVKNADKVIDVLKKASVTEEDQATIENVFKVLTSLKENKSLSSQTLGDALNAAELAELSGSATQSDLDIKKTFEFMAEKFAVKVAKMFAEEAPKEDEKPVEKKVELEIGEDEEDEEEEMTEEEKAQCADKADDVNKRRNRSMDLSQLPVTKDGALDVEALKKAKFDANTITVLKSLHDRNSQLAATLDKVNEQLKNETELRVDKHFSDEASAFEALKFEGLKDVLKKFGTACPEEYPKLKGLLKVAADAMKPAANRDFSPMGGSQGNGAPSGHSEFYDVMKRKATELFKGDKSEVAMTKFLATPEGREDFKKYDAMLKG